MFIYTKDELATLLCLICSALIQNQDENAVDLVSALHLLSHTVEVHAFSFQDPCC